MHIKLPSENVKGRRDHSQDLGIDWRIMLGMCLEEQGRKLWTVLISSR